ncbi:SubName: Full=Related to Oxidoreductase, short-chain dehydrogenase {ECO:0000313/EMBL:CCA71095.1} [Serendipita indica DSM 11827]|nr:SubName: Full=Related to Oxidoreductase, short-chain dehydrogenase {ECO:0000313/EMBL:CCA71095.1} [Serendipita indica DSM 11827]
MFTPDDVPDLSGRVAIVTGGNRSIGLETVYMLLRKNCNVWIAGRSQSGFDEAKKILETRQDINKEMLERLHFQKLDLSGMKNAQLSAQEFARNNPSRLDIVIGNAGISMQRSDELSSDGYELTMQTNHFGHFSFIITLLPLLTKTAKEHGDVRVVMTTSDAYAYATNGIDFESLTRPTMQTGMRALTDQFARYGASKLANMLFARELDRGWATPLRKQGAMAYVDCAHPGAILNTGLGSSGSGGQLPGVINLALRVSGKFAGFSALEGAMTQVWVATTPDLKDKDHGKYYVPVTNWRGRYVSSEEKAPDTKWATDDELAAKLWKYSEDALVKAGGQST